MATRAFHQEVVSRLVTDAEDQLSMNGWRARNDGDGKRVLARESPEDNDPHDLTPSKGGDLRDRLMHRSSC